MKLLLASDFDGTLAAIQPTPETATIDPLLEDVLVEASRYAEVEVAVISGRDLIDLRPRLGRVSGWLAGSHGLEIVSPDYAPLRSAVPRELKLPKTMLDLIAKSGTRLEWKKFGAALHWRGAEGVDQKHPVIVAFALWAKQHDLEIIPGRAVAEARLRGGDKADALRLIAEQVGATRVVFAGDDLTDLGAIEWASQQQGRGIFFASKERTAPEGVESVATHHELARLFREELDRAHRR